MKNRTQSIFYTYIWSILLGRERYIFIYWTHVCLKFVNKKKISQMFCNKNYMVNTQYLLTKAGHKIYIIIVFEL